MKVRRSAVWWGEGMLLLPNTSWSSCWTLLCASGWEPSRCRTQFIEAAVVSWPCKRKAVKLRTQITHSQETHCWSKSKTKTNPKHERVHFLLNVPMVHHVAILISSLQEHVQKCSPFLRAPVRLAVWFNVRNELCSFMYHLRRNENEVGHLLRLHHKQHSRIFWTTRSVTHFVCEGMEDFECLVMLLGLTKAGVH